MEMERGAFVGREAEWRALDEAFDRALRYKSPTAVTVVGPIGFGKTRLLEEWLHAHPVSARVVRASAAPVSGWTAAGAGTLIAGLLRHRFGLEHITGDEALFRFRAELQKVFGDRRISEVAGLLGGLLGFELTASPLVNALAGRPEQAVEVARAVLGRFLERDAAAGPLLLACEDLHAADDASLDVLEELIAELGDAPILIVGTARPELYIRRPTWGTAGGAHTRVDLGPLSRDEIDALIRDRLNVAVGEPLAPGLGPRVAAESSGSPFLVEQLLAAYRELGILVVEGTGKTNAWRFDGEEAARRPSGLTGEAAAQIRVAALSPAERDVLARGAIFGSVFWTGGVVALGRLDGAPPDEEAVFAPDPAIVQTVRILRNLVERGYVKAVPDGSLPNETAWGFRHELEQRLVGAGADPELVRRRKAFAAQWLESRGAETRGQRLEALAALYEDAGDAVRAAYCLVTAAGEARAHLLLDRAHVLYLSAIRLLDLDDAVAKMDALYAAGDIAARLGRTREAIGLFQDMLRLAWRLDLPNKGGAAHGRIGRLCVTLGEHSRARTHLELAHKLFEVAGDYPGVAAALDDVGRIHFLMGAPERSLECHRAALAVREQLGDARGRALTLSRMGQVQHEMGALPLAAEHFGAALSLRRELGDQQGEVASLLDLGALERDLGQNDRSLGLLGEGRDLARALGERLSECSLGIEIGDCHLAAGQPRPALEEFRAAREIAKQFGARVLTAEATRGIAEAELALGDAARARDDARAAFEIADRVGAPPLAGAALRVIASSVGLGAPAEADLGGAREMFDRSVEVLTKAGAEMELARTLSAYADFEERIGRTETASELRRQASDIGTRARRRRPSSPVELSPPAGP
jgi:tetratricopeptide (TPR) repeat protein